jgi:Domain of unknown function (DUF4190)
MSYPPPPGPQGGNDPYGQQPQPYGQQPNDPYGQQQPNYPQYGEQQQYPTSGAPQYPTSGAPQYPTSGAAGQYPTSGAGQYPTSGGSGYGYQQPYSAPAAGGTNIMAILSLVFAFVFAPAGIVLGHIAKKQIKQTGEQGSGLATAGLVLSYIFTGISLIACCAAVIIPAMFSGSGSSGY